MATEYRDIYGREGTWAQIDIALNPATHARERFYSTDGDGDAKSAGGAEGYYDALDVLHWKFTMDDEWNLQHDIGHEGITIGDYTGTHDDVYLLLIDNADSPQPLLDWDDTLKQFRFNKDVFLSGADLYVDGDITLEDGAARIIKVADIVGNGNDLTIHAGDGTTDAGDLNLLAGNFGGVYLDINMTAQNINTACDSFLIESDDTAATVNPILDLYRNSANPANDDYIAKISFNGESDNGDKVEYARISSQIDDVTDDAEAGRLLLSVMDNGAVEDVIEILGGTTGYSDSIYTKFNYPVGVGVDPDANVLVHIQTGEATIGWTADTALAIEDDDAAIINLATGDNGTCQISMGDESDNDIAYIRYDNNADDMTIYAADDLTLQNGAGYIKLEEATDCMYINYPYVTIDGAGGGPLLDAALCVEQANSGFGKPVAYMRQADVDQPFDYLKGTSALNTEQSLMKTGEGTFTIAGYAMRQIEDTAARIAADDYFVPFYSWSL